MAKLKRDGAEASFETDLSADEKTLAEVTAACMIIDERMHAYEADLAAYQTKLEGLNERMVEAERAYHVRAPHFHGCVGNASTLRTCRQHAV